MGETQSKEECRRVGADQVGCLKIDESDSERIAQNYDVARGDICKDNSFPVQNLQNFGQLNEYLLKISEEFNRVFAGGIGF